MAQTNAKATFTEGESKMIMTMFKHATASDIQTDWNAVAAELGYKDAKSARDRWSNIKRAKFGSATAAAGGGASASTGGVDKKSPNKKSPVKPKKAGTEDDKESPVKGKGGRKSKAAQVMSDGVEIKDEQHQEVVEELDDFSA